MMKIKIYVVNICHIGGYLQAAFYMQYLSVHTEVSVDSSAFAL